MSKEIISIWCAGCQTGYRNRQALSRHQKKVGCTGSFHDGDYSAQGAKEQVAFTDLIVTTRITPEVELEPVCIDSLAEMLHQEKHGMRSSNSSHDF
jgi:hypothetical protein